MRPAQHLVLQPNVAAFEITGLGHADVANAIKDELQRRETRSLAASRLNLDIAAARKEAREVALALNEEVRRKPNPAKDVLDSLTLDEERHDAIVALLEAQGGAAPLGQISKSFPGVKKVQLEKYFELRQFDEDGHGQFEVRLPGCTAERAVGMHGGIPISSFEDLPKIDEDDIQSIAQLLHDNGGFAELDTVFRAHPHVKKQQLKTEFNVNRRGISGAKSDPNAKRTQYYEVSLILGKEYPGGIRGPCERADPKATHRVGKGKGKNWAANADADWWNPFWETYPLFNHWGMESPWTEHWSYQPPGKKRRTW